MRQYLTTKEVADTLRLKERKIYELVRSRRIPCVRITGKLLFPREMIDLWVARNLEYEGPQLASPPPIAAGSHDPLLEWALRESGSELALFACGSEEGLSRLASRRAVLAGLHLVDPETGEYNSPSLPALRALPDIVLIEWAKREQGLVLAPGNPHGVRRLADVKKLRVARRQEGAGAQALLYTLLQREGLSYGDLELDERAALTETDLALRVRDGKADCGVAVAAVAREFGLDFVPLKSERFDLAMRRRDYFEPPLQRLLQFASSPACRAHAAELGGYNVLDTGRIVYNA
jgi:putative molybdopterin biosynthesis protein